MVLNLDALLLLLEVHRSFRFTSTGPAHVGETYGTLKSSAYQLTRAVVFVCVDRQPYTARGIGTLLGAVLEIEII